MDRDELIDGIMRAVPVHTPEEEARAREMLAALGAEALSQAFDSLSFLDNKGVEILAGLSPEDREAFLKLREPPTEFREKVMGPLNEIRKRIVLRQQRDIT